MLVDFCPFLRLYDVPPQESISLFDLEALVMRRMELLDYVDGLRNSPTVSGLPELLQKIHRGMSENFAAEAHKKLSGVVPPPPPAPRPGELEVGVYLGAGT